MNVALLPERCLRGEGGMRALRCTCMNNSKYDTIPHFRDFKRYESHQSCLSSRWARDAILLYKANPKEMMPIVDSLLFNMLKNGCGGITELIFVTRQ